MNNVRVKQFKLADQLIGRRLPTNHGGHAGRALENLLESMGVEINRGKGCDSLVYRVEVKSRDLDATSPQTVATMAPEDIATVSYKDSVVCEKFQQQFRVYTKDGVIVDARVHDFSVPHIQEKLETAYNNAQVQFILGTVGDYVYGSEYGYFERTNPDSRSYSFRINVGAFEKLESMAASTYKTLFEEVEQ
jgi:hypothetical protein